MKKNVIVCVWAFVLIIFETVICRYIGIKGVYPEIVFAFVMCAAVLDDDIAFVTALSCVCGLITDCLGGGAVGVNLFSFGVCAVLSNYITEKFFMPNIFVLSVCVLLSTFITRLFIVLFGFVIFGNAVISEIFMTLILQYVLYDFVTAVILYILLKRTVYSKKIYDRR